MTRPAPAPRPIIRGRFPGEIGPARPILLVQEFVTGELVVYLRAYGLNSYP